MDDDSLGTRGKFAIIMILLVVSVAVGMRIYRQFNPLQIDSIFVEDLMDYDQLEESLFGNTTGSINYNATVDEPIEDVVSVATERSSEPVIQLVGTRMLTLGQAVQAEQFQDSYVITYTRDNQLYIQTYSKTWESTLSERSIDTKAAIQRQLVTTASSLYLFSLREDTSGYQLDVMQLNEALEVQAEFVLFTAQPTASQFTAAVDDEHIFVYTSNNDVDGSFFSYDSSGDLLTERSMNNNATPVALTVDQADSIVLVTATSDAVQFIKVNSFGEELSNFSISLDEAGYVVDDFMRWQDYVVLTSSFSSINSNYSQLLIWSKNLTTQYPSIHFNSHLISPNILSTDDGIFLVYVTAETSVANATEVTTYTVQVDQLQTVSPSN